MQLSFFFSNLILHAIQGELKQIISFHYTSYVLSDVPTSGVFICHVCIYLLMHDGYDDGSCSSVVACLPIEACVWYVFACSLSGLCAWDWVVKGIMSMCCKCYRCWGGVVTLVVVGGGYYYPCICSLCARIYFSLHAGSMGERSDDIRVLVVW